MRLLVYPATLLLVLLSGCENLTRAPATLQSPETEVIPAPLDTPVAPVNQEAVSEPQSMPVAVEPQYTNIWDRMRSGFQLSHEVDRKRVLTELKWYVKHPEYVERVSNRANPYLHYIVTELENRGMPLEFALLPIVESAYDPFAYSHGRAAGLWQFIPSTARVYGLRIDWWYDGRRDVRASTKAALDYLEYLHDMFNGDWLLAMAAYNSGQGNVLSSIRKSNLDRANVDFWSLKVLRETYTYVPRLLAISEVIANPERYHMTLPEIENKPQWQAVNIASQLDLEKAAELADITAEEMYQLNPGFNQWATHPDGPHELLIPIEKAEQFAGNVEQLAPHQRLAWTRHKIKYGESLGVIAQKYNTTIDIIRTANDIRGNMIRTGDSILIPAAQNDVDYKMTAEARLASRQKSLENSYGSEPIIHVVQPGDSFWEISRQYGVGMRQLAKWNGMGTTGLLHPGTELKVFNQKTAKVSTPQRPKVKEKVRKLNYRVREGESLSLIASKFNVTVQNIKGWNQALHMQKYIHPGDRLTLYVDVTALIN
jgi:membrane-bound lytic murein transglycosylase D